MGLEVDRNSSGKSEILRVNFDPHTRDTFKIAVEVMTDFELGDYSSEVVDKSSKGNPLESPFIRITARDTKGKKWTIGVLVGVVQLASQKTAAEVGSPRMDLSNRAFYPKFKEKVTDIALQLQSGELKLAAPRRRVIPPKNKRAR